MGAQIKSNKSWGWILGTDGDTQGFKIVKAGTMGEMLGCDPTVEFYVHRRLEGIAAVQGARQEVGPS